MKLYLYPKSTLDKTIVAKIIRIIILFRKTRLPGVFLSLRTFLKSLIILSNALILENPPLLEIDIKSISSEFA